MAHPVSLDTCSAYLLLHNTPAKPTWCQSTMMHAQELCGSETPRGVSRIVHLSFTTSWASAGKTEMGRNDGHLTTGIIWKLHASWVWCLDCSDVKAELYIDWSVYMWPLHRVWALPRGIIQKANIPQEPASKSGVVGLPIPSRPIWTTGPSLSSHSDPL